jgi:hypothetical protein
VWVVWVVWVMQRTEERGTVWHILLYSLLTSRPSHVEI